MTGVVPMAAGGSTDFAARALAQELGQAVGQAVVVENRAGATGAIGTQAVVKAAPDGNTLLVAPSSVVVFNPLVSSVPYDPVKDLTPIGLISKVETIIVASRDSGLTSLRGLIDYAKAHPRKLNYGSNGMGSAFHLAGELFLNMAGIEATHVPYKGASLAEVALLSNEINWMVTNTVSAMPHIKSGRMVPLAIVSTLGKSRELPDVPDANDTVPGYYADTWVGLYGPAGVPKDVAARLNGMLNQYLNDEKQAAELRRRGLEPTPGSQEDLQAFQRSELAKWSKVVAALKTAGRLG